MEIITIIGEIEGHDHVSNSVKATRYENLLPKLAEIEINEKTDGILFLLNTMGGDVEAGLAIAEMIASLSKPTVSLVLGGSHSIGVPIAVSTDYSFIVPSATMVIHPIRSSGIVLGTRQTFEYFQKIQERITDFVCAHCEVTEQKFESLMTETKMLTKDMGTLLIGKEAVNCGLINQVGGIRDAVFCLKEMIKKEFDLKKNDETNQNLS